MSLSPETFWWLVGITLMLAEFILPGLVSIFLGLAAITVALLLHFEWIHHIDHQVIVWCLTSIVYIFTLRLLVMKFYPMDTFKQNIDEDLDVFGQQAIVTVAIPNHGEGRIRHDDSTWKARSKTGQEIAQGERVTIVGRNNITWLVEKISHKEE